MGAILAIERDGVVYMGTDAERIESGVRFRVNAESNIKIHRLPSGILCGVNGQIRLTQRMYLHDEWFRLEEGERFDKRFLVEKIVPRFYEELCKIDGMTHEETQHCDSAKASFLFAKDGNIYVMYGDLSVAKCQGIAALSNETADDSLMYAYARSDGERDPEALIRKTFAYAARMCGEVSSCGHLINTRDLTLKRTEDVK